MREHVPLYASAYAGFTAREQVRHLTYGAELTPPRRRLRIGGPALYLAENFSTSVFGIDLLEEGIATATQLAHERRLDDRAGFARVDAGARLPFDDESYDAVISVDAMCHLPNRLDLLHEWHRYVAGRAGSLHGPDHRDRPRYRRRDRSSKFHRDLRLLGRVSQRGAALGSWIPASRREDLTENMASVAGRWHDARMQYRDELLADEGESTFENVQRYLSICHRLARERRLSRYAYLAGR